MNVSSQGPPPTVVALLLDGEEALLWTADESPLVVTQHRVVMASSPLARVSVPLHAIISVGVGGSAVTVMTAKQLYVNNLGDHDTAATVERAILSAAARLR